MAVYFICVFLTKILSSFELEDEDEDLEESSNPHPVEGVFSFYIWSIKSE